MTRLFLLVAVLLASCAPAPLPSPTATVAAPPTAVQPAAASAGWPRTIKDGVGRDVTLAARPTRIVSYLPSNTETLFAIGAGDRVVGVDNFSDFPSAAAALPKVGDLKPNLEAIVALKPDLVVIAGRSPDLPTLLAPTNIPVLVVEYKDLRGTYDNFRLLGRAVGSEADAEKLVQSVQTQIDAVSARTASARKPRVYYELDGSDPAKPWTPMPGHYIDGLIGMAGGVNVLADSPASPFAAQVSAEAIVAKDPEVILVGMPGDDLAGKFRGRPGWSGVTAVKSGSVRSVDGLIVSRPGPRMGESVESLARAIHPELFR